MGLIKSSWLKNKDGEKFSPIALAQKVFMKDGMNLQQFLENDTLFSIRGHEIFAEGEEYPTSESNYYIYESSYPKTLEVKTMDQLDLLFKLATPLKKMANKEDILSEAKFIMLDEEANIWIFETPFGDILNGCHYKFVLRDTGNNYYAHATSAEIPITEDFIEYDSKVLKRTDKISYYISVTSYMGSSGYVDFKLDVFKNQEKIPSYKVDLSDYVGKNEQIGQSTTLTQTAFVFDESKNQLTETQGKVGAEVFNCYPSIYTDSEKFFTSYGFPNTAIGIFSHARGENTKAIGDMSSAEGTDTYAFGLASSAQGAETIAYGDYSCAQGKGTVAYGKGSHAQGNRGRVPDIWITGVEGSTIYSYTSSNDGMIDIHVGDIIEFNHIFSPVVSIDASSLTLELEYTLNPPKYDANDEKMENNDLTKAEAHLIRGAAYGDYSSVQGVGTTAYADYSHAQGRYNILDVEKKYAHIVGNGTSWDELSNAHTVDWDGNGWYQGNLFVGGTGKNYEGAKKLATEEYVNQAIANSGGGTGGGEGNTGSMTETSIYLTDTLTSKKYQIQVIDGKLTMTEVAE